MGQYKVPQNVEAEDKILGPLTFKEFIYFLIGFGWAVLSFALFHVFLPLMILVGGPPTMLFLLLAFYNRDGQSFEQLLLAMVQFFAASRRRAWVKDEVIESFHVEPTKPKQEMTQRDPAQVRGELEKLANLIDSRGWNHPIDMEVQSHLVMPATAHADRIVAPPAPPKAPEAPADIMDLKNSPMAQNLAELLRAAAEDVRTEALQQMSGKVVPPTAAGAAPIAASISGVTAAPANDILQLATQSDELTVSQLAAQATRRVQLPGGQTMEVPAIGS
ncbi:MAG TPA: PrgI family protein [Candidatus Saccharimonadia bacterium]|jgi:hypothetical protein|nr:PrgI family protein [Candidatus Saccharimonadia bacterium]